jgi:hypothetical protein
MAGADIDTSRVLRDVIRADLVVAAPRTLDQVRDAARRSLATLTTRPHLIHVAPDARGSGLARVMIDGPTLTSCLVIEV